MWWMWKREDNSDHYPLWKLTFQEDCNIENCGPGWCGKVENLKKSNANQSPGIYVSSIQPVSAAGPDVVDWLVWSLLVSIFFLQHFKDSNLASLNGGKAPDVFFNPCQFLFWVNVVGDQGEIEEILWGEKTKSCQVSKMNYFSSSVVTLVSVSMPLSNTLLWILKACLQRKSIKPKKNANFHHNHHFDHGDQLQNHYNSSLLEISFRRKLFDHIFSIRGNLQYEKDTVFLWLAYGQ